MNYLGDFTEDDTVYIRFTTHAFNGELVQPSFDYDETDFKVYKNNSTAKTSDDGITVTSVAGVHTINIDTNDDTGASGFWATGADYFVSVDSTKTIDSINQTGVVVGHFSLENRKRNDLTAQDVRTEMDTNSEKLANASESSEIAAINLQR